MKKVFIWLVLYYLRFFARIGLLIGQPKVVGITGSVGKSSTRNAVFSVLSYKFGKKVEVIKKGNSETGIPLGILGLKIIDFSFLGWLKVLIRVPFGIFHLKNVEWLVVEMGVDDPFPPKNMGYLLKIVKPDIAIFLNIHPVHTMQFFKVANSREEVLKKIAFEKGRIITESGCKIAIYNASNKYVREVVENFIAKRKTQIRFYSFGENKNVNAWLKNYVLNKDGTTFKIGVNVEGKKEDFNLKFKGYVLQKEYFETFAPALILGCLVGLSKDKIEIALTEKFKLPPSRATIFKGIRNSIIIDSSYNASYASTSSLLDAAFKLKKALKRPLVFVFGDMRELGGLEEEEHLKIAKESIEKADYLYLVGKAVEKYVLPIVERSNQLKEVKHFFNSREAGKYLRKHLPENALVLVKGSQNTIYLEEAVKEILSDKEDAKKLCRQEDYWIKLKERYFENSKLHPPNRRVNNQ